MGVVWRQVVVVAAAAVAASSAGISRKETAALVMRAILHTPLAAVLLAAAAAVREAAVAVVVKWSIRYVPVNMMTVQVLHPDLPQSKIWRIITFRSTVLLLLLLLLLEVRTRPRPPFLSPLKMLLLQHGAGRMQTRLNIAGFGGNKRHTSQRLLFQ